MDLPETFNAVSLFVDAHITQGRAERPAIYYEGQVLTYADVYHGVNRAGNLLLKLGVEREQRVLILMPDSPEWIYAFWGAMKIGAVPIPVNTNLKSADYQYILQDSRARVLVTHESLVANVEAVHSQLTHLRHIVVVGATEAGQLSFSDLFNAAADELEAAPTHKDEPAFWLYSSGTTGFPKGAVHLHHDPVYVADHYGKEVLKNTADDRHFSVAKLFFAYGIGNGLFFPFRVGGSVILDPQRPDPKRILELIQRYKPSLFFSVPTNYNALLQIPDKEKYDLSSIRFCVSAGEALPAEIWNRWHAAFGLEILDGIGSTEILHIFLTNLPGQCLPGSSGKPVPGYEMRLLDDDGLPVPQGEVGNLWVKGDSTMAYYWNKHEKTKETLSGDWIRTGDKYHQDENGFYWYDGRSDDMIKAGGQWVSPVEVEGALLGHPAVLECGVVGQMDKDELVKPKAFVALKPGYTPSEALADDMKNFVKTRIAPFKYPRWIEFISELPKTATGKIQRFKLRQLG